MKRLTLFAIAGALAGLVNGLFGGGGGMVLLPALKEGGLAPKKAFATCVAVIFPICLISAAVFLLRTEFDFPTALPYLIGGAVGGIIGGRLFKTVSNVWLRRIFAAFLLYGGVRYLL